MEKTPLYEKHLEYGGEIIDFGGWALPIKYRSIKKEHHKVREKAGLFDVSHMGEIWITGVDAEVAIQYLITNDISRIDDYQIQYSPMCSEDGGVVDDLLVYKYNSEKYLLVINGSNIQKDFTWIEEKTREYTIKVENVSHDIAQLALQGPSAEAILQPLLEYDLSNLTFYHFKDNIMLFGYEVMISRTGYTGEDGFEIYMNNECSPDIFERILNAGKELNIIPCGLGARDTLRFEACLPLYGHEISESITPLEAGLKPFVKLQKEKFIGKETLNKMNDTGLSRKLVAFEMVDKGIPRPEYGIYVEEKLIGHVTTGGLAPSLNKSVGLAIVESQYAKLGETIEVKIRDKKLKAIIVKKPFYNKKYVK